VDLAGVQPSFVRVAGGQGFLDFFVFDYAAGGSVG
jgi:hypothetical protein